MSIQKIIIAATAVVLIGAATIHQVAQAGNDMGIGISIPELKGRGGGSGVAPLTSFVQLESGAFVLLEAGGKVVCEGSC